MWLYPRLYEEVRDDQHSEDRKRNDAHCPSKTHFGYYFPQHDWEDNTTNRGAGGGNAECSAAFGIEPSWNRSDAGEEDEGATKARNQSLCKEYLVILAA